jgi:hypothetical protein
MNTLVRTTLIVFSALLGFAASAQPAITLSQAPPLSAGNVALGLSQNIQVNVTNTGTSNLIITNAQASGPPFTLYSNPLSCGRSSPLTVIPGDLCQILVIFTPTTLGTANGTYTLTDNVAGSPQVINLIGVGMIAAAYNPSTTSLSFGSQALNTTSASMTVTLSNPGTVTSLNTSGFHITGDFAQTNDCGASLGPLSFCTFHVTFTPTAAGTRTGTLDFCPDCNFSDTPVSLQGDGASGGSAAVPALSRWGLLALAAVLAAGGLLALGRRS